MTTTPPPCDVPGRRTLYRRATVGGPPWPLPVALLLAAAAAQVVGAAVLVRAAPDLARGVAYGPDLLLAAHLLGLGFLTVAIVGALMQLIPVLLRVPLCAPWRGALAGGAIAVGAWSLALGLSRDAGPVVALGGTLVTLGGIVVLADLGVAVVRSARAGALGASGAGLAVAGGWFAVVLALGVLMAVNRTDEFLPFDRMDLIAAHAAVALLGWVGGAILAVALRLAPMFALSHGYARRPGPVALVLWHAAVPPVALGLLTRTAWVTAVGGLLVLAACGAAGTFVWGVARHRRRRPEAPLLHLAGGVAAVAAGVVVMLAGWAGLLDPTRAAIAAVLLALVGMGAGSTSGHLFKVLPMLIWTGRFARLAGTPGAPRLQDLYPARLARVEQTAFAAGLPLLVGGVLAGAEPAARLGAALLLAAAVATAAAAIACLVHRAPAPAAGAVPVPHT